MEIFKACYERRLITEKELLKQFISYIESCRMTKVEKEFLEAIEEQEGLFATEEDTETKKLRRFIREHSSDNEMQQILVKENLVDLPFVSNPNVFREDGKEAPVEALKFILTSYISQWTYMDSRPSGFHTCNEADYVAGLLKREGLLKALESIACEEEIKYPRRMIAFLRYADEEQLEHYIKISEEWENYEIYGEQGILAKETFEQAILINDSEAALLHAYRNNKLNEYAFLRKITVEDLFLQIVKILEKKNLTEELHVLHKKYIHKLHVDYLSGSKVKRDDWYRWNLSHPSIRNIAKTLVWQKAEKKDSFFVVLSDETERIAAVNENGEPVHLEEDCEICLAHPVYM